MPASQLCISNQTYRRFILGKQGLFPGRRWQGKAGAAQAIREGVVVQIDPLCIIARSHEIALHSRVLDYSPDLLTSLLYTDRAFFDYGGVVRLQPMAALPYWRVIMARKGEQRAFLAEQNPAAMLEVLSALRERGPLANRDFDSEPGQKKYWHAAKSTAQALYYLWLKGEVMTHSRRGFERRFDLAERIVPPAYDWQASVDEAEVYFECRALQELGLADLRDWRAHFMGMIERKVSMEEAAERLEALLAAGKIAQVRLEEDAAAGGAAVGKKNGRGTKAPLHYLLAEDLPLLEDLHAGRIPDAWQALGPTSADEAVFLAPLDIVSARGRALPIFGFEYKWEVYTPVTQRRWGYYVLPILYGDRLVGRIEPVLDRRSHTLTIKGFWLEAGVVLDQSLKAALSAALRRFADFVEAGQIEWASVKLF